MKNKKIIIAILVIFIVLLGCQVNAAFNVNNLTGTSVSSEDANQIGNRIITTVSTIGSITSVIVLVILGIKYMLGSVEEKASYKSSLLPYVIGASLVFAASFTAGVIYTILN